MGVHNIIGEAWKIDETFTISDMGSNTYVFSFQSEADLCRTLCEGPWTVMGSMMVLRKWDLSKSLQVIDFTFSPLWVQVVGLPLGGYLNQKSCHMIAPLLGDLLRLEDPEKEGRVAKCLRIRVWINLKNPLKKYFFLKRPNSEDLWVKFQYERLPNLCYGCGIIGHVVPECKLFRNAEKGIVGLYR